MRLRVATGQRLLPAVQCGTWENYNLHHFGGAESRHTWEMYSIILFIFHSKTAVCILLELKIS